MGLFTGTKQEYYDGSDHGDYQFVSLKNIVYGFMVQYVGTDKIIPRIKRADVVFHAKRSIQEFTYDIFKSTKSQEIEVPINLQMTLPHDYVNYIKLVWVDENGIERIIYPTEKSSNPLSVLQDDEYRYLFDDDGELLYDSGSTTASRFQTSSVSNNEDSDIIDYEYIDTKGSRFGIDPQYATNNGLYFIDNEAGKIFFDSQLAGKIVTLKYISDGLAEDDDMLVHKLCEQAVYARMVYEILCSRKDSQLYLMTQWKNKAKGERNKAKIRMMNIKFEELTQIMRGKSKVIKH